MAIDPVPGTNPNEAIERRPPPLRENDQPDASDPERITMVRGRWHHQDMALLERDKNVEQHCRMLMGDQWSVWSPLAGMMVNVAEAMGLPELLWRELPRVNLVQDWFDMTIARLTENPPVWRASPRDADRESVLLAEASDVLLPKLWDDLRMTDRLWEIVGWMAVAGWSFFKTYADFTLDGNGTAIDSAAVEEPTTAFGAPGQSPPQELGRLAGRVPGPLDVRGEWGQNIPWQDKRWHIHRMLLRPDEVLERFGVEVAPDTSTTGTGATSYYRMRLERGPGHYGSTDFSGFGWGNSGIGPQERLVTVDEMWERPSAMFPDGRLTVTTAQHVLYDGPRPFPRLKTYNLTSPITYIEWQRIPGRPYGTTPLERGVPIQRQINLGARQFLLHRAKMTNPVLLLNAAAGLDETDAQQFQRPGSNIVCEFPPGTTQPPAVFIAPAALGADAWKVQEWLERSFERVMDLEGAGGIPQTANASGEQVKELRFNSDRPASVPVRHLARGLEEIGCLTYVILPEIWPAGKTVSYVGKDRAARTMILGPELFDGQVKVEINAESMMPRSRQEREAMAFRNFQAAVYGQPGTPEAMQMYLKQSAFEDFDEEDLPLGVDAVTAKHLLGLILQGTPGKAVPMLEQWNYGTMLQVVREFMASPEFLKLQPPIQQEFQALWLRLQDGQRIQALQQLMRQQQAQGQALEASAPLAHAQAILHGHLAEAAAPPQPQQPAAAQPPSESGS